MNLNPMNSICVLVIRLQRRRDKINQMKTKAEIKVMHSKAKEGQRLPETRKSQGKILPYSI